MADVVLADADADVMSQATACHPVTIGQDHMSASAAVELEADAVGRCCADEIVCRPRVKEGDEFMIAHG